MSATFVVAIVNSREYEKTIVKWDDAICSGEHLLHMYHCGVDAGFRHWVQLRNHSDVDPSHLSLFSNVFRFTSSSSPLTPANM